MHEEDDINVILGAALEARGLSPEQSSSLIKAIEEVLKASDYYMTKEQHQEELKKVSDLLGYHLQTLEEYSRREKQCITGGCIETQATEEVLLPELEAKVYLCNAHKESLNKKKG